MPAPPQRWIGPVYFEMCALAAAATLSSLLFRDERTTATQGTILALAIAIAALPPVVRIWNRDQARRADVAGAGMLAGCAVATYPIGGLGLLVSVLFMLFAGMTVPGTRWSIVAAVVFVALGVLMPVSLFDPGGSMIVVVPVFGVLCIWAAAELINRPKEPGKHG